MENLKKIWPEWRIIEKVGEGSFGKVYKCVRDDYGITLYSAVKVITIPQNESEINNLRLEGMTESETRTYFEGIVNDFANEIKMMVLLRNAPNIVPVENYAIVEHEGKIGWSIYIRMEYLTSFGDYVLKNKIDEADVKKFGLDMCSALEICAKKDIIHRDIKPDNIFIDEYDNYRLGDFGVARQLENTVGSMSKKGTYSYMAPEVYRGGKYDNRADIYSLGMVMYKILNNKRDPFLDPYKPNLLFSDRQRALERRMNGERFSAPCNASAKMAEIILKAVEFRPEDRFATVEEFKNALNALNVPVTADEPTVAARDFEEKTVAARDVEQADVASDVVLSEPDKAYFEKATLVDYSAENADEATVVMADEPTAIDNREATVVADCNHDEMDACDDDPDATLIADGKQEENANNKQPSFKKSLLELFIVLLVMVCVVAFLVFYHDKSNNTQPTDEYYEDSAEYHEVYNDDSDSYEDYDYYEEQADTTAEEAETEDEEIIDSSTNESLPYALLPEPDMPLYEDEENEEIEKKTVVVTERISEGERLYLEAEKALKNGNTKKAAILFGKSSNYGYSDARKRSFALWDKIAVRETVSAGEWHTAGLKADGTVVAVGGSGGGKCEVDGWKDIVAVSTGTWHTVGLKSDGTVVAVGSNDSGRCDVDGWTDIVAVSAGTGHTVGLKSDGTVVAVGYNIYGQCDVDDCSDIVAVSAVGYHTVGLKADGTVVAVGYNGYGQCDVDSWSDIVAISADGYNTVGLKSDGTVVAVGRNDDGPCDVDSWSDIVAVSAGFEHTVGLKSDGTVVAVGDTSAGRCDVDGWKDIVAVAAGHSHTVGLKSDGTVVAVGDTGYGQCNVDSWKNIKIPK